MACVSLLHNDWRHSTFWWRHGHLPSRYCVTALFISVLTTSHREWRHRTFWLRHMHPLSADVTWWRHKHLPSRDTDCFSNAVWYVFYARLTKLHYACQHLCFCRNSLAFWLLIQIQIQIQVYWFVAKRLKYKINIKHKWNTGSYPTTLVITE